MTELLLPSLSGPVVDVVVGARALARVLPEVDALALRCGLPVTARGPWLRASLLARPVDAGWAVLVRDRLGELRAAALLCRTGTGAGRRVVSLSGGDGHRAGLPAADADAAHALGVALAAELDARSPSERLELGPLAAGPLTDALADGLGTRPVAADPVPALRRTCGEELATYLTRGSRRTLRQARNRLATDRRRWEVRVTSDRDAVQALLPQMADAYRDRDGEHGVPCVLDSPAGLRLWQERTRTLLDAGLLELSALHVDGRFAAHVLGVRDGRTYRVLEGRFHSEWSRYSPGRLLEAAVLQRVLLDPRYDELDWMTGVSPETLLAANSHEEQVVLLRPPPA